MRHVPLHAAVAPGEERANIVTHGTAALLSLLALALLAREGIAGGSLRVFVGLVVFGVSLVNLYVASTLYHGLRGPAIKRLFRILDHTSIFVLIAGTYTPVALVFLRGSLGWLIFGLEWGLALLGILFKVFFLGRLRVASVLFYLAMGWLAVAVWKPLLAEIPRGMLEWIVAGGICYTLGVLFFSLRRMPYHHAVWHLFTIGGSLCHFVAIYLYAFRTPFWA